MPPPLPSPFPLPGGRGWCSKGIWVGDSADSTKPWPCSRYEDVNFATLSKRKCCNFLPSSRLDKHAVLKKKQRCISLCFQQFQQRRTKSAKIMWSKGEKKRRFAGTTLFKTQNVKLYSTLFKTENPDNDALTVGASLYRTAMGVAFPGGTYVSLRAWVCTYIRT